MTRILTIAALSAFSVLAQPNSIRDVDFKNIELPYEATWDLPENGWTSRTASKTVKLKNGRWAASNEGLAFAGLTLEEILYGDLTGDGNDEAVLVLRFDTGGTMNWHHIYVFTLGAEGRRILATYGTGERSSYGLHEIAIQDRTVVVELYDPKKQVALCCSTGIERTRYQWNGYTFVRVGPVERGKAKSVSRRSVDFFGRTHDR